MVLKSLDQLIDLALQKPNYAVAVAGAADRTVIDALFKAFKLGIIGKSYLIGEQVAILEIVSSVGLEKDKFEIIDENDITRICSIAVNLIKEEKAQIIMKGLISSSSILKAVLHKENGLKGNNFLSHFALIQTGYYQKILGITDAAINIRPDINEKVSIIENAVNVLHKLGNSLPKVAIIAPLETVNPKITSSTDAAVLTKMNKDKKINGCIIEGPLSIDIAVSKEASIHKGLISEVAGESDILVFPDLDSSNSFYKALIFLSDGVSAAIVTGAPVPIVLTSRADDEKNKLYSIALAVAIN